MARLFDGVDQYLQYPGAILSSAPLTLACWFNSTREVNEYLISISTSNGSDFFVLSIGGYESGEPVQASIRAGWALSTANSTSGYAPDGWYHGCAVFTSTTLRAAFINGANKGTNTDDRDPGGMTLSTVGGRYAGTLLMSGALAEVGIWNAALTDGEVGVLGAGLSPLFVRPQNLVAYWPLIRDEDQDRVGGYDLTAYNSPTIAPHVPIRYPISPMLPSFSAALRQPRYGFTNFQVPGVV